MSGPVKSLLTPAEIRVAAHKMGTKYDKSGCIIEDSKTHNAGWIDEMLEFGMSVFESVAEAQLAKARRRC